MKITVEHEGKTLYGNIATVEYTRLGWQDHGILTASVGLKWDGGGVAFGGYCLDRPKDPASRDYDRAGTAYGLDHIMRIVETVGVETWEKVKGAKVIAFFGTDSSWGTPLVAIGGLDNGKVFDPKIHAAEWRAKAGGE